MARLTNIVTRTGDQGETGLVSGERVSKDSPRVWAYGTIDELSSAIGVARANNSDPAIEKWLLAIQHDLFDLGAELATPPDKLVAGMPAVTQPHIDNLEKLVDDLAKNLGPLKEFILPGGNPVGAQLHVARTICRRAERFCVRLSKTEKVGPLVIPYLNRLSDALFMLARWANKQAGDAETYWRKPVRPK
jgi:cob(I)alamin adenosyltransferase